jgi:hypothetical protein
MIGLLWEPDISPLPAFLEQMGLGQAISPEEIDPEMFLPWIQSWYQRDQELPGDVIQPFTPAFGIPWVEAIAGCPVVGDPGSLWAQPSLASYANRRPIRIDLDNPWLRKLVEFTQAMVRFSDGRFPVALPQMRGPLDTLAALRTPTQMCMDLVEESEAVHQVLAELTDLWIGVAETVLRILPPFHGGYCSRMKMWAPGPTITLQNDISTLISPRMYKEFVLPLDEIILNHFPYHCFHVHGSEHHQIGNFLKLEQLTVIQLTLEHTVGGPPLDVMLPALRRILQKKPLLLCALDVETADKCIEELPPAGLCVTIGNSLPDIPEAFVRWIERHCS